MTLECRVHLDCPERAESRKIIFLKLKIKKGRKRNRRDMSGRSINK
jgi:hypothetical protein